MSDVTDKLLARRHRRSSSSPIDKLIAGVELTPRGGRRPGARRRSRRRSPTSSSRPIAERVEAGRRPRRVAQRVWQQGRDALGRPGRARDRQPAGLADDLRRDARARARADARSSSSVKADGLHRRGAAGHGRLEPRPRGDPALVRRHAGRAAPARARLDRPRRGARGRARRSTSTRRCSSSRRSRAGRSRRSRTCSYFYERTGGDGNQFVAVTDPGSAARRARAASAASGACSRTTRTSAGATRCCRTSGSCRPR